MSRYVSISQAAKTLGCDPTTVSKWAGNGFITVYAYGERQFRVDLDEIENAFQRNPRMRDPRRPKFGPKERIVPLPVMATVLDEGEGE